MKVVGWEEKRGSIKTGQLGTGFLGPGFSPGSRVCSFRKFPRLSLQSILFPVIPPTITMRLPHEHPDNGTIPHCFGVFLLYDGLFLYLWYVKPTDSL